MTSAKLPWPLVTSLALVWLGGPGCGGGDDDAVVHDARRDAAADAAGPRVCGGFAGATCRADEFCDFARNTCSVTDEQGVCRPRPTSCPDLLVAVPSCGCDGQLYASECEAQAAGTDLNDQGGCPVPSGWFACGHTQCNLRSQYCQHQVSDVANEPDGFTCPPLPGCPSELPTCACLAGQACGSWCTGQGATGLTLTCPGG